MMAFVLRKVECISCTRAGLANCREENDRFVLVYLKHEASSFTRMNIHKSESIQDSFERK
jgi:hypothetical protein